MNKHLYKIYNNDSQSLFSRFTPLKAIFFVLFLGCPINEHLIKIYEQLTKILLRI